MSTVTKTIIFTSLAIITTFFLITLFLQKNYFKTNNLNDTLKISYLYFILKINPNKVWEWKTVRQIIPIDCMPQPISEVSSGSESSAKFLLNFFGNKNNKSTHPIFSIIRISSFRKNFNPETEKCSIVVNSKDGLNKASYESVGGININFSVTEEIYLENQRIQNSN